MTRTVIDTKTLINPNLYVLCQEAQELILDGWKFSEGYPVQLAWVYHANLEKEEAVVEKRTAGRPPKADK